jgi:hypothetical protein
MFPLQISYRVLLSVLPLPRCDRYPELHPPMPFVVVFSFLRHSGRLSPTSFIRLLPRSCCFRPRSLMPFLHSGLFQRLFSSVHPFRVSSATSSWSYLLRSCHLHRATFALRVILIPAAAKGSTISLGPNFPDDTPLAPCHSDGTRVMLTTIQSRTFCLLVCCLKT